jgi:hypothetical protein
MGVPRRLPPTQGERVRNIDRGHAALSARGRTASARPVPTQRIAAPLYQPETWSQSYSYPGELTVTPGTARIYNETARLMALRQIRAAVGTSPAGASVVVDVKVNGVSIFTNPGDRPTISAGGNVAAITAPPRTLFLPGDYLTVDIAQVGSSTAGSDLTVQIRAV